MEIWKTIEGFENYQVSNLGNVKSFQRGKIKILKRRITKLGYDRVCLRNENLIKDQFVHRLVAKAFLNNDPNNFKIEVNHIDGNKLNNCVDNLEWCTTLENLLHSYKLGRNKKKTAVVAYNDFEEIYFDNQIEAGKYVGKHESGIRNCLRGKAKTCGNYKWKYYIKDEH
jgi:hypothetical protein